MTSYATLTGRDYVLNLVAAREQAVDTYWVALCFSEPGVAVDGTELDEPTQLGYVRAELPNISGNWDVIHAQLTNVIDVIYPLADEDWGEVRYWAVCDSQMGGRVFWAGEFEDPRFVGEGDQVTIPAYGLDLYFGGDEV